MNVIPQSPPIKVQVREVDAKEDKVIESYASRIIGWEVEETEDGTVLHPLLWRSGSSFALSTRASLWDFEVSYRGETS